MKRIIQIGSTSYRLLRADELCSIVSAGHITRADGRHRIVVDANRPARDETLLHEIFHGCEKELVAAGLLSAENSEHYVEHMAGLLYRTLRRNGFLVEGAVEWEQLELFKMEDWMAK